MDSKFIQERISFLRTKKGVSEYKMSLDLGHSKGYIQSISSGKSFPSVPELLYICDYLGVTPKEFFDEESNEPQLVHELYTLTKDMSEEDLTVLINTAKRLNDKK
jgi:transcriptional regulator with XRE-family HTH domain